LQFKHTEGAISSKPSGVADANVVSVAGSPVTAVIETESVIYGTVQLKVEIVFQTDSLTLNGGLDLNKDIAKCDK